MDMKKHLPYLTPPKVTATIALSGYVVMLHQGYSIKKKLNFPLLIYYYILMCHSLIPMEGNA